MVWSPAGEGNTKSFGGRDLGSDGAGAWSLSPFVAGGCRELWTYHPGAGYPHVTSSPWHAPVVPRGHQGPSLFPFPFFSFSFSFFPFSPFRPQTWPQPLPHSPRGLTSIQSVPPYPPLLLSPPVPPKPPHPAPRWAVTNPSAAHLTPPVMPSLPSHFCPSWPIFAVSGSISPPRAAGGSGSAAGGTSPGQLQGWGWHRAPTLGRGPRAPGSSGVGLGSAPGLFTRLGIRSTSLTR